MAIDTHDFVIPEQQYGGLYKVADTLGKEKQRKDEAAKLGAAKKASMATFLNNYIDPKDYFTGTVHDPHISDRMNEILTKGAELAQQDGVDANMLTMALSPMVTKLGRESQNLKELERQRKEAEGILKTRKGIDADKFNQAFKKTAYYNPDGSLRDIASIDPTHNYIDDALNSGDVYTSDAVDEFVAKSGKSTTVDKVKVTDARGGSRMTNAEMTAPTFMVQDKDENGRHLGFVPKYEIATDGDKEILHDFLGDKGEKIKAPVRMLTDDVFETLPKESMAYLRQETKKYADKHNIPLSSQQALNFAKALGYDVLKNTGKQYSTFKEIQEQKAAPAPRTSITVNTGNANSNTENMGNEFDVISDHIYPSGAKIEGGIFYNTDGTKQNGKVAVPISKIPVTIESAIKSFNNDNSIKNDNDFAEIEVVNGVPQSIMTQAGFPLKRNALMVGQQNIGKGAKFEGKKPFGERGASVEKTKEVNYKIKGKTYSEKELLGMGYTLEQIKDYKQK